MLLQHGASRAPVTTCSQASLAPPQLPNQIASDRTLRRCRASLGPSFRCFLPPGARMRISLHPCRPACLQEAPHKHAGSVHCSRTGSAACRRLSAAVPSLMFTAGPRLPAFPLEFVGGTHAHTRSHFYSGLAISFIFLWTHVITFCPLISPLPISALTLF